MSMMGFMRACLIGGALAFFPAVQSEAQALRVVEGQTSAALSVPMNRAVVVESDLLFAEISVANPAIADIATLSERTIYVLGRMPGRTTMTLLGPDGALIANIEVQVVPDVAELRERLREILRNEPIEVRTANDGVVLSGTVSSGRVVERAMELAETLHTGSGVEPDACRWQPASDVASAVRRDEPQYPTGVGHQHVWREHQRRQHRCVERWRPRRFPCAGQPAGRHPWDRPQRRRIRGSTS